MNKIIKQHDNANYSKEQSDVEKYIMKIIQRYFLVEQEYSENQIESIIVEAIRRVKIYLADHQAGVFAVNHKTGNVHLDITDFDGEPAFDKNTAFNKDFGDKEDTICEGNDYRLSNPREPLPHTHYVDEIPSLEDLLYDRYGLIFISHIHRDKEAIEKIIYTGTQPEIDLILIEQFMEMVVMFIVQIKNIEITAENIKKDFSDFIDSIEPKINDIIAMYSEFLSEQSWAEAARKYTNGKKDSFVNKYTEMLKSYITYDRMVELTDGLGLPIYETGYFNFNPTEEVKFCKLEENITNKFDISAKVYDDNTGLPLENVEVKLDNSTTKTTSSTGAYTFDNVPKGEHIITFNKHNYYDDKMYTFITSDHTNIEDVYMRPITYNTITGYVKNTRTNEGISGATVTVSLSGKNTVTTDENGMFTFENIKTGTYTFTATHASYESSDNTLTGVSIDINNDKEVGTIMLTPLLADNTYEFHDEWTQQSKDLDMHLFGQIEGQDIHVYYSNKHEGNVHLDVDAQGSQSSGFAENGTFTFNTINDYIDIWIQDYNNRSSTTTDMQNSGLKYRLKMGKNTIGSHARPSNGVVLSRDVPSNPSNTGPWLYVGKITPNGFTASNTYKESRT